MSQWMERGSLWDCVASTVLGGFQNYLVAAQATPLSSITPYTWLVPLSVLRLMRQLWGSIFLKLEEVSVFLQRAMFPAVIGVFLCKQHSCGIPVFLYSSEFGVYQRQLSAERSTSHTKGRNRLCTLFQMVCSISALQSTYSGTKFMDVT